MITDFKTHLTNQNLSQNTISSYLSTIKCFFSKYENTSKMNLLEFKDKMCASNKPKTVNLRIQAINKYLEFTKQNHLKLSFIKIQQMHFFENVISNADYEFLKNSLVKDNNLKWHFIVRFLAATGARVSELVQIKIEHIHVGYIDMYSKGGKTRRIYIPKTLINDVNPYIATLKYNHGYLFQNAMHKPLTTRGIAHELKKISRLYMMNDNVVYPHSFRHRFAKNFLDSHNDIALLSDRKSVV